MATERPYGRYILEERIAMGGMAEIFRARTATEGFAKTVCIKRVLPHFLESPDFVSMFRDEAALAARLQHANVVHMFDFGKEEGTLYLAMELVDGADLKKLNDKAIKRGERWGVGQAIQIGIEMARGLYHAHTLTGDDGPLHIVHRDISPHNVLVSRAGEVKITDFGIAKASQRSSHTSTGVVKGKLSYMAPEQADGSQVDHRVDQFATALVVWETLCGKKLFDGDNEAQVLRKVLMCEVMRPSAVRADVPAIVDEVLLKALSPSPDDRYPDMRAFERALTKASFELSDDPGFTDLRPFVRALLDNAAAPRKTAVLDSSEVAAAVEGIAASASDEAEEASTAATPDDASAVFTTNSGAKVALEQAGLAASAAVETVMAEATQIADGPYDAPAPEVGNTTEPTRTVMPATIEVSGSLGPVTEVNMTGSGEFSAQPEPPAAFPRRMAPEAVVPTERVPRAEGPDEGRRSRTPLFAGGAVVAVFLLAAGGFAALGGEQADPALATVELPADAPAVGDAQPVAAEGPVDVPPTEAAPNAAEAAPAEPGDREAREAEEQAAANKASTPPPVARTAEPPSSERVHEETKAAPTRSAKPRSSTTRRRSKTAPSSNKPVGEGKVFVNVIGSWAHVYRGKKKLGTTPVTVTLPAGAQRLRLKNPETGKTKTVKVNVSAGGTAKIIERL